MRVKNMHKCGRYFSEGWMEKKSCLPGNQTVLFESISSPPILILHDQNRYIGTFIILYWSWKNLSKQDSGNLY